MGSPLEDKSRGYEIPFVFHDAAEFDVAAELGLTDAIPTGEFTRCEHILVLTEFDCSQGIEKGDKVALRLTFQLPAGEQSLSLARDVSEFLHALHEYDKVLGGRGLGLDPAANQENKGGLSLVLRPNDHDGAANRFRRMAEQLGSPVTDAPPKAPNPPLPQAIFAEIATLWKQTEPQRSNGTTTPVDLTLPRQRVERYRVQFALLSSRE